MQAPGQPTRNRLGLIVTAFALAIRVQGDRDNHVRAELLRLVGRKFGEPGRKPITSATGLLVFQQQAARFSTKPAVG